jgi:predicted DNA-binding ribbon-helix-helix protein
MSVLTVRLPESKHARIKEIARARGLSTNKFIEELTTIAIAQQDMLTHFTLRASRGDVAQGLAALDDLDMAFKKR